MLPEARRDPRHQHIADRPRSPAVDPNLDDAFPRTLDRVRPSPTPIKKTPVVSLRIERERSEGEPASRGENHGKCRAACGVPLNFPHAVGIRRGCPREAAARPPQNRPDSWGFSFGVPLVCPVLLIAPAEDIMIGIKKILVATDFGLASETALRYGRELARAFQASLEVMHVTENLYLLASTGFGDASFPVGIQEDLERDAARETERLLTDEDRRDLRAKAVSVTHNTPAAAIVDYARDCKADLILVGTHGRVPWDTWSSAASPSGWSGLRRARC
jgi:nucleotide-binding universal stress UspA family protein